MGFVYFSHDLRSDFLIWQGPRDLLKEENFYLRRKHCHWLCKTNYAWCSFCSCLLLLHYTMPSCHLTMKLHCPGGLSKRAPKKTIRKGRKFSILLVPLDFSFRIFCLTNFCVENRSNSFDFSPTKMFINYSCGENSHCCASKIPRSIEWRKKKKMMGFGLTRY